MSRFTGANAVIEWIYPGGTAALTGQYRRLSLSHHADVIETTGGTATHRDYVPGLAGFSVKLEGYHNGTANLALGTAQLAALAPRTAGTLRVSPLGTATGKPRYIGAALVTARDLVFDFDDLAAVTLEWRGSGTLTQESW